ncbi:hypothetical protein BJ165DRAFT_1595681 [Panaeolus papilionaceus]|nr:hypothetical protein BJ165DRAFT_1595681 [Panaeolus papilionaceus]
MSDNHNNSVQQWPSMGVESHFMDSPHGTVPQDLHNVLVELYGPALPLPFDEAYWNFTRTSYQPSSASTLDYTYGFLSDDSIDIPTWNMDRGSTELDPSQETEFPSCDPEGTPDEFDNLVAQFDPYMSPMSLLGFPSSKSWDPAMNFSWGFDEKILFDFTRDDTKLPVPKKEYIVPHTVDTMRQ